MRITTDFFKQDVLDVAPALLGMYIVRQFDDGSIKKFKITETEAYRNEEDLACHCSKGRTKRTEIMYHEGGKVYVYLIYGMYWMLNFVCYNQDVPQAVLIRAVENYDGPGKVGKALQIDKSFYGEDVYTSNRIWIEKNESNSNTKIITKSRVGIDYAGKIWKNKKWRFVLLG